MAENNPFLTEMRERLESERSHLLKEVASGDAEQRALAEERHPDIGEEAAAVTEKALLDRLGQDDQAILGNIDAALSRIESGEYTECSDCGEDIPEERLRAYPMAVRCVQCQSDFERGLGKGEPA